MHKESYEHGVPSWVDVSSPDAAVARAFYSGLFGWDAQEGPPETGGYSVCLYGGHEVAGIGPQQMPGVSAWMTYVNVNEADAIVDLVKSAGGQVFAEPFDVLDVGRMGIFADPTGAVFGVWEPKTHMGAGVVNEPNTLVWNELITTDVAAAKAFYAAVFGWGAEDQGEGAYTEWKISGNSIGGMMAKNEMMPAEMPSNWGVYFGVEDADAAVEKVKELGGSLIMGPMDIEPGRFAVVVDPGGAVFNVIAMKPGADE